MWKCSKCNQQIDQSFDVCWNCGTSDNGVEDPNFTPSTETALDAEPEMELPADVLLSTTDSLQTHSIVQYIGIVHGEAVVHATILESLAGSLSDAVNRRSKRYEAVLSRTRKTALTAMANQAKQQGANAVTGIRFDIENLGGSTMMIGCSGTAVRIVEI